MRFVVWIGGMLLTLAGLTGVVMASLGTPAFADPWALPEPISMPPPVQPVPVTPVAVEPPAVEVTPGPAPIPSEQSPPANATAVVVAQILPNSAPSIEQPAESPQAVASEATRPITWLAISRIHLQTKVVPAPVVPDGDSYTWDIPSYVAGHAESTAGAGQVGNAVILGHVVSRTLGNVFEYLDRARPGDLIQVGSGSEEFDYRVVEVRDVDRTDVNILDPTPKPTITLITCAGIWNPILHDYMERLIVRGELVDSNN
jgi:sortase A